VRTTDYLLNFFYPGSPPVTFFLHGS